MRTEDEERLLREQARIEQFEKQFAEYLRQRTETDAQQIIGRDHDTHLDEKGDISRQRNEKIEQIDRELDHDARELAIQDLKEKAHFEKWMREQRNAMRDEDATQQRPEKLQPRPVPSFGLGPNASHGGPIVQQDKQWQQRESLRNDAAEGMRERFAQFQEQQHETRLDKLNQRADANRDKLDAAYKATVELKAHKAAVELKQQNAPITANGQAKDDAPEGNARPPLKLNRRPSESDEEYAARVERAQKRADEEAKKDPNKDPDLDNPKPKGPTIS